MFIKLRKPAASARPMNMARYSQYLCSTVARPAAAWPIECAHACASQLLEHRVSLPTSSSRHATACVRQMAADCLAQAALAAVCHHLILHARQQTCSLHSHLQAVSADTKHFPSFARGSERKPCRLRRKAWPGLAEASKPQWRSNVAVLRRTVRRSCRRLAKRARAACLG